MFLCVFLNFCFVFLPHDASAEHGDVTVSRLSVRPSVCPSVTIRYHDHIHWNTPKIISLPNSLRSMRSFTANMGDLVQREHPKLGLNRVGSGAHKTCQISETVQDRTKVTITD